MSIQDDVFDLVRVALIEEGWVCEHTNDDGPEIIVDVNAVAARISSELTKWGLE